MARQVRIPTKEEIERDKPTVLKAFQEGLPMKRIQEKYGMTQGYVIRLRKELLEDGSITMEEIKTAYNKYIAENPSSQGLDKHRKRQESNTEKSDANHAKIIERDNRVFDLIRDGKTIIEIANDLQITETGVAWSIKRLIENGRLTTREISKKTGAQPIEIDKTSSKYIAKRNDVVYYLRLGWRNAAIREKLNITPFYMDIYIKDIKAKKIMSSEQIKEAREMKKQFDLIDLEKHIKAGRSLQLFRELHPEFHYNEVSPLVKELIEAGKITREQIDENGRNSARNAYSKNSQLSMDEQMAYIIDKMREGYAPKEIAESDETKSISLYRVLYYKRKIIEKGIISEEEAKIAMQKRQKERIAKSHIELIDTIKEYTIQGYNLREIAEKLVLSYTGMIKVKAEYEKENGWFTKEELNEFKKQRREREKAKELARQKAELEELERKREAEEQRLKKQKEEAEKKDALKKQQELARKLEKEKRQRIQYYAEEYKKTRKLARNEDKLEFEGEEDVPVSGRKKFLELLTRLYTIGAIIPDKDIEIILNTIYLHHEFANKDSLKLLIFNAVRGKGIEEAEKMVATLVGELGSTRFSEPLWKYKKWLQRQKLLPKIAAMKEQGLSNTAIGEQLGITSAEVMVFYEKAGEKPEFFENESR